MLPQAAMPTSLTKFKNHPQYALEKQLGKADWRECGRVTAFNALAHPWYTGARECIHPKQPVLGHFKGEPVYPRACVRKLHARVHTYSPTTTPSPPTHWLTPCEWGLDTLQRYWFRKRARKLLPEPQRGPPVRVVRQRSRGPTGRIYELALFGEWQTAPYTPPPIVDGVIPRNDHGNGMWCGEG